MSQLNQHLHPVVHFGYLVFREKFPLSFFDNGLDSYVGNSVFLGTHGQNTVYMSKADFTSEMLHFAELSMAMVQATNPYFIDFAMINYL